MDFDDFQNYRTGKQAEDAANAAKSNQREINKLKKIITNQYEAQEREKNLASGLFQLTSELENDYRLLSYEPTEEAAEKIAKRYINQPVDEYLDHKNYSALEYKELANKTKGIYDQLLENAWFKWGADKVQSQIAEQERIARKIAADQRANQRREKELAEAAANSKFWGACIYWPLQLLALFSFLIVCLLIIDLFIPLDPNVEGGSLGEYILTFLCSGSFGAACQWGAIVQWKKHGGFIRLY